MSSKNGVSINYYSCTTHFSFPLKSLLFAFQKSKSVVVLIVAVHDTNAVAGPQVRFRKAQLHDLADRKDCVDINSNSSLGDVGGYALILPGVVPKPA
jgi:hypothetical protein